MPRRKQPKSLEKLCLSRVVGLIIYACKKSSHDEAIQRYVQDIPNTLAKEYVDLILLVCSNTRDQYEVASAFHPKCTMIGVPESFRLPKYWYNQLMLGVKTMTNLAILKADLHPYHVYSLRKTLDIPYHPLPNLEKLRSIAVPMHPLLYPEIIQNCKLLEEIEIKNFIANHPPSKWMPLAGCKHLKKICVIPMNAGVAVHLLANLPKLEILQVDNIKKVLQLCEGTYSLKDFATPVKAPDETTVRTLVAHFPCLENLSLQQTFNTDPSPLNKLHNLKTLKISDATGSHLQTLMDGCMVRLSTLSMYNVSGLDTLFRENVNQCGSLEKLKICACTGIDLVAIGEIFPNISELEAEGDEFVALPLVSINRETFRAVKILAVSQEMPQTHFRYLLSTFGKWKQVFIFNDTITDSFLSDLLTSAKMKDLRYLHVEDDSMTKEVIPAILDSSGDDLRAVCLIGDRLSLSINDKAQLYNHLRCYDMHVTIFLDGYENDFVYRPS